MEEVEELIDFDEECERQHRQWLSEFEEKIWPVYESYGYSFPQAVDAWQQNIICNHIRKISEHFDD